MRNPKSIRNLFMVLLALASIGLAGDAVSGARHEPRERADVAAIRDDAGGGDPQAWARTHHQYVIRAGRADADVVFLGDSITYAWGGDGRRDLGAPHWQAEIAPLRAANFGFPGDQTQHLLHRVEDGELAGHPRVAVVLIGTNNVSEGQSPEAVASGIVAVVDAIHEQSPRTRVLLLGLLPRGYTPDDPIRREVAKVNAILSAWADQAQVDYLDPGAPFIGPEGKLRADDFMDFIHPSPEGYRLLTQAVRGPLRELLGRD